MKKVMNVTGRSIPEMLWDSDDEQLLPWLLVILNLVEWKRTNVINSDSPPHFSFNIHTLDRNSAFSLLYDIFFMAWDWQVKSDQYRPTKLDENCTHISDY